MNELQPESERGVEDWQGCRRRASVMGIRTWIGTMPSARSVDQSSQPELCRISLLLVYGSSKAYFPLASTISVHSDLYGVD